ncbi:stearoyl-ACP-desaturase [Haematococcus lacustris]
MAPITGPKAMLADTAIQGVRPSRPLAPPRRLNRCCTAVSAAVAEPVVAKPSPIILDGTVAHSITHERLELIRGMGDYIEANVSPLLREVGKCWQPSDLLPHSESPDFLDQEALPTYMTMLNSLDGVRDETGASNTPWAKWTRWARVVVEGEGQGLRVTVQNLIGSGMNPKTENNPYLGFVYTSFQERATKISHGNTARHALEYGDDVLAKICGLIASDEGRHEQAYSRIIDGVLEHDPDGGILAFADMMRKQIVMPAHLMDDGQHEARNKRNLFADFSSVAERTGTYTAFDYADIMQHLITRWRIAERQGLSGEAAEAQEYLVKLPDRIRKLAERSQVRKKTGLTANFSWIFNREVVLH